MNLSPNRRSFLKVTAGTVAAPTIIVGGALRAGERGAAGDRVNLGVIGLGSRGYNLIDEMIGHDDAQVLAICDVDMTHYRDRPWGTGISFGLLPAKKKIEAAYTKKKSGRFDGLTTYTDFRELIARDDIDAIVVATPDHWHALCTLTALRAGKDVYCEKPVTHLFHEGQLVYREVEKQQAVFQTGSQQRSDAKFRRAVELVHNGLLGKITGVEVGIPPGYDKPQGDATIAKVPKQLDYDFWCGPSLVLPYMRARHHRWWRGHRAYGGGVLMDWIGHHNDIAHWALGMDNAGPVSVEAIDWTFPETDIYNTPHHYTIACEYPGGIQSTISSRNTEGLKLIGEEGWVFVRRGRIEASDPRWTEDDFDPGHRKAYASESHTRNFLDCIKSRKPCIAPAQTAHRSITPGHLSYISHQLGRRLQWDPVAEQIDGDDEANQLLRSTSYRKPWSL